MPHLCGSPRGGGVAPGGGRICTHQLGRHRTQRIRGGKQRTMVRSQPAGHRAGETPSCLSASGKSSAPKSQTRTPPGRPRRFGVRNEVVLLKISGIRHAPSVYTLRSIPSGNFCFSPNFQTVELFTDTRSVFPNILS